MNDPLLKTDAGAIKGATAPRPVVATPQPGQPQQPSPGNGAGKPVEKVGSPAPGRTGEFKFPVNTPEGQKERREADAERKRLRRQQAALMAVPLPLPPSGPTVAGNVPAPSNDVSPGASNPPGEISTAIPWTPELIKDMSDELIDAAEDGRRNSLATLAQEGGLPDKAVKKIHADAAYKPAAKRGLQLAVPKITARMMNKTGISSEHSDTLVLVSALAMIWKQGRSLKRDVIELIELNRQQNKPKPEAPAVAKQI